MPSVNVDNISNSERVSRAFSAQAPAFDAYEEQNAILQWMRRQVYRHEEDFLSRGDSILELNAGSGIDAMHFARAGHSVFAIDNAPGMLDVLNTKVKHHHLEKFVETMLCSFTDLHLLPERRFDHVFSNFGGLNCIPDLRAVTTKLPALLKPGATVTFVVMPRVCPWELIHILKGNSRLAFRRFSRNGTPASIEGIKFLSYYFSPGEIIGSFDKRFSLAKLRGLASFSPPPQMLSIAQRHPQLYALLAKLDERCSGLPPFNRWADHCIITMKYLP
ncbi:MAG TPA: class I SAM-dependent methyltransferase [Bacteroidota bacterium]|nr:class I SAM-dependent methyltransferase [Bacteroidota bacterium]